MKKLKYGNWIRTRMLWLLGMTTLAFGIVALLPLPVVLRVASGILALAALVSFLYPLYSYFMFSPAGGNMQEKIYNLILEHLESPGSGKILDIGAGNGILAVKTALRNQAAEVTGVDYWGGNWEYSKTICEQNARIAGVFGRVDFQKGNAASLKFPDAAFDAVVSNLTFHEVKMVKRKLDVLREALRVLKPGGCFVFIDYFYDDRHYGDAAGFNLLLWSLKLQKVEFKPLREVLAYPKFLNHPRALGKVGIIYGRK